MNNTIQTLIVILMVGFAVFFLIRKFVWRPRKKAGGACDDNCACH